MVIANFLGIVAINVIYSLKQDVGTLNFT